MIDACLSMNGDNHDGNDNCMWFSNHNFNSDIKSNMFHNSSYARSYYFNNSMLNICVIGVMVQSIKLNSDVLSNTC